MVIPETIKNQAVVPGAFSLSVCCLLLLGSLYSWGQIFCFFSKKIIQIFEYYFGKSKQHYHKIESIV
jgi:hypothetical protein